MSFFLSKKRMKHKFSLSINQIFLTLVRNIVRLLQNRVDGSIDEQEKINYLRPLLTQMSTG